MPAQHSRLNKLRSVAWVELSTHVPPLPNSHPQEDTMLPFLCTLPNATAGVWPQDGETNLFRKTVGESVPASGMQEMTVTG